MSEEFKLKLAKELNIYECEHGVSKKFIEWDSLPFHKKLTFILEAEKIINVIGEVIKKKHDSKK
uniref:Uncharacterized protein n=1 Tax=viral metagenome TaxID=1070528 RepID=A0A6M3KAL3_9ZZZZ